MLILVSITCMNIAKFTRFYQIILLFFLGLCFFYYYFLIKNKKKNEKVIFVSIHKETIYKRINKNPWETENKK